MVVRTCWLQQNAFDRYAIVSDPINDFRFGEGQCSDMWIQMRKLPRATIEAGHPDVPWVQGRFIEECDARCAATHAEPFDRAVAQGARNRPRYGVHGAHAIL